MWTHTITGTGRPSGVLQVYVKFTSAGHEPVDAVFSLTQPTTEDWLKPQILASLDRLNGLDANEAAITKGPIDVTPIAVIDPSPDDVAAQQLRRDKIRLEDLVHDISLGVRTPDDAAYVALKASITDAISAAKG